MVDEYFINHFSYMWTSQQNEYVLQEVAPNKYLIIQLPNDHVIIEDGELYEEIIRIMLSAGNSIMPLQNI